MKRKIDPMPVDEVYLHPEFIRMPAAGRGMLFTLLLHYWLTDCAPLPTSMSEFFAICRPSPRVWDSHKETMLRIFNAVAPGMAAELEYKKMRRAVIREMGERGRGVQRLRALARKQAAHGAREEAAPARDPAPRQRVATPEERGARARVAPGKGG
jgi:hypothetical protein